MLAFMGEVLVDVAGRVSARRPIYFLLLRQKKVAQEKATQVRVSLRCAKGNLRCSQQAGAAGHRADAPPLHDAATLRPPVAPLLGANQWGPLRVNLHYWLGFGMVTRDERRTPE